MLFPPRWNNLSYCIFKIWQHSDPPISCNQLKYFFFIQGEHGRLKYYTSCMYIIHDSWSFLTLIFTQEDGEISHSRAPPSPCSVMNANGIIHDNTLHNEILWNSSSRAMCAVRFHLSIIHCVFSVCSETLPLQKCTYNKRDRENKEYLKFKTV